MTRNCNELEGNTERKKSSLPSETPFSNILTPLSDEDKKKSKTLLCREHCSNGGTIVILPTNKR